MNRTLFKYLTLSFSGLFFLFHSAAAEIKMPGIFGNNMVLQRDMPIPVWGKANPGEKVTVTMGNSAETAKADRLGNWRVKLPPMVAGGPFRMSVKGENVVQFDGVLIGDVWLCGGQSNMQWQVHQTGYEERDSSLIEKDQVRLFTVDIATDYKPKEDLSGTGWKKLSPENISRFSAVAYHFGKYIHQELGVPVGLISDNLGATSIETWMSYGALSAFPQFDPEVKAFAKLNKSAEEINRDFEDSKARWYHKTYYKGPGIDSKWYLPETDVTDWATMEASGNTWETTDLKDHDGAVWFRKTFDLPVGFSGETYLLNLSQIDDHDIVWINGEKVGETFGRHNHRNYEVPARLLKPKNNVIVVRIFDAGGIGGFTTSAFWGNPVLWGEWKYRKGMAIDAAKFQIPVVENVTPFSTPGALFNGSIAPVIPYGIKGVIWYQGESNADRADRKSVV